jgi:tRNA-dihydrouridine synthase A
VTAAMNESRQARSFSRISVAPMMDWTDRHCRYFFRLLSPDTRLYSEMIVDHALINGDPERLLAHDPSASPVALQLGGSDPDTLAAAVRVADGFGYDEINLNIGCPSDRVQSGRFGACLMAEPQLVADCVAAMIAVSQVPVTVKTRIGIDNRDDYEFLSSFIEVVSEAGCGSFVIHARKAILAGLSPK